MLKVQRKQKLVWIIPPPYLPSLAILHTLTHNQGDNTMLNLQKVQRYNDNLRYNWVGGQVVFKRTINDLPHYLCNEAIQVMRNFPFSGENNRHDNGSFTLYGKRFIWWIEMADCSFDGNRYRTLFFSTL